MEIIISKSREEAGREAASLGAGFIRKAIQERNHASIIVATGTSQFEMLSELVRQDLDWSAVTAFHLDEYIGISDDHPASFCGYLRERFANLVPLEKFHFIDGTAGPEQECSRLGNLIKNCRIDVAFVGIGENGHLAFNDPPADFETDTPYLVVNLDERCRRQQSGEGWFATFDDVPSQAISMSIRQIMKSETIICTVPDERKADAVYKTITSDISPMVPASILREHSQAFLLLDTDSASHLNKKQIESAQKT